MSSSKCQNCGRDIKVAIYKGTEWCSNNCRKTIEKNRKALAEKVMTA